MNRRGYQGPALAAALAVEDDREYYEERAAILEYQGNLPRPLAESRAREQVRATALLRRKLLAVHIAATTGVL